MKKIFFVMGALVSMTLANSVNAQCCPPVSCGCGDWYVGAFGGFNWISRKGHDSHHLHNYKNGYLVGGDIGYRWDNGFRVEGEVSYRHDKNHGHRSNRNNKAHKATAFLANALYQFDIDCFPVDFYVGGGLGWVNTHHNHRNHHDGKNNGFAWQLIAGIAYPICENLDLDLEYRFFDESKSKFYNSSVDLGFRYYF